MTSATGTLLVGEAPSRASDADVPFSGRSGDRLRELLGRELEPTFATRNLFVAWPGRDGKGSRFDLAAARGSAALVFSEAALDRRQLVLVGKRVAGAFGVRAGYLEWQRPILGVRVVVFPHPSGVNRWWNDPSNVARARDFLRSFL